MGFENGKKREKICKDESKNKLMLLKMAKMQKTRKQKPEINYYKNKRKYN